MAPATPSRGIAGKIALGLVVYGWVMLLIDFFLHRTTIPEGPDGGLALFRQVVMGRAALLCGAGTVIAAVVLGLVIMRRPAVRRSALIAVATGVAWLALVAWLWTAGQA